MAHKLVSKLNGTIKVSVSATSREARPGELNGQSYYFLSRDDFEKKIAVSEFFEWEENHGNLYGTLKSTVEQARTGDSDLLLVIDIRGAITIKNNFPKDTVIIFLTPPNYTELVARLDARGKLSSEERQRRLETTKRELSLLKEDLKGKHLIDYLVVNDKLEDAEIELISIIIAERLRAERSLDGSIQKITDTNTNRV